MSCCASSDCRGKRSTPCSPSARRMAPNSASPSGCDKSMPSTFAPRVSCVGVISMVCPPNGMRPAAPAYARMLAEVS